MILLSELNKKNLPLTLVIESNLITLCARLNKIREAWGKPMIVTSGLRSEGQQENLIKAGRSSATHSKHLVGCAADILDEDGSLKAWLKENPTILEDALLWCEAAESTPTWCHFQIVPPGSGHRWFLP